MRDLEDGERGDPGGEARQAHERQADDSAYAPPTAAATTSEATFPTVCSPSTGNRDGKIAAFSSTGTERISGGPGPDRDEARVPEREHARVADEHVQRDDDHDRRSAR